MKVKINKITFNFEIVLIFITFIFILSKKVRGLLFSFYMCYLFILFHELSHIFIASIFGKKISRLNFTLSGLNVNFYYNVYKEEKDVVSYIKEIIIYLAGPISNFLLCFLFCYNKMIFEINICLALINLLPIYPLDGYNILKNIINILYLKEKIKNKNIVNYISNLFFLLFLSVFIILFIKTKNVSNIIFFLYILCYKLSENLLKNNNKKIQKIC